MSNLRRRRKLRAEIGKRQLKIRKIPLDSGQSKKSLRSTGAAQNAEYFRCGVNKIGDRRVQAFLIAALHEQYGACFHAGTSVCRRGVANAAGEVGVEQAVEKMFRRLRGGRRDARRCKRGNEASLDGIADGFVFILNFFADFDAGPIFLFGFLADVGEIVIEDDGAFIDGRAGLRDLCP